MIKLTRLSNAINKSECVAWAKKDHHNYILSEHFVLKTHQEIKGSALTKLITFLGTVPQEGQGVINKFNQTKTLDEADINQMISLLDIKDADPIQFTNLIHQTEKDLYSIFKGKDYIFIKKKYMDLINLYQKNIEIYGTTKYSPIFFKKDNEELMILPVNVNDPFYLKEIKDV